MHASFNDLVTLRQQPHLADASLVTHVRSCTECAEQLLQLQSRTEALRRLPSAVTAPDRWDAIQRALAQPVGHAVPARPRPGWWLAAASAAAVVFAALLTFQAREPGEITQTTAVAPDTAQPAVAAAPNSGRLIEESQRLEHLLAAFPESPRVIRASTAMTVADLEDRIQWVDYRLNLADEAGLASDQSRLLWRERVDLLSSLVAVRYAQSRTLAF